MREKAIARGKRIELYVAVWVCLEALSTYGISGNTPPWFRSVSMMIVSFRVLDIIQAFVNMSLFDRLRFCSREHYTASSARVLLLSGINFFELAACFGAIYSSHLELLSGAISWSDAYYFSIITQLTIGYGDICPLGALRLVAAAQGLISYFFALSCFHDSYHTCHAFTLFWETRKRIIEIHLRFFQPRAIPEKPK